MCLSSAISVVMAMDSGRFAIALPPSRLDEARHFTVRKLLRRECTIREFPSPLHCEEQRRFASRRGATSGRGVQRRSTISPGNRGGGGLSGSLRHRRPVKSNRGRIAAICRNFLKPLAQTLRWKRCRKNPPRVLEEPEGDFSLEGQNRKHRSCSPPFKDKNRGNRWGRI